MPLGWIEHLPPQLAGYLQQFLGHRGREGDSRDFVLAAELVLGLHPLVEGSRGDRDELRRQQAVVAGAVCVVVLVLAADALVGGGDEGGLVGGGSVELDYPPVGGDRAVRAGVARGDGVVGHGRAGSLARGGDGLFDRPERHVLAEEIGRASCRERVCNGV